MNVLTAPSNGDVDINPTPAKAVLWDEILGMIIVTADAKAAAQRDLKITSLTVRKGDENGIANFHYSFNKLFTVSQCIVRDEELKTDINAWLNDNALYSQDTKKTLQWFNDGIELYNRFDNDPQVRTCKRLDIHGNIKFPFEHYLRYINGGAGTGTNSE